jgi:hypothetical protein
MAAEAVSQGRLRQVSILTESKVAVIFDVVERRIEEATWENDDANDGRQSFGNQF